MVLRFVALSVWNRKRFQLPAGTQEGFFQNIHRQHSGLRCHVVSTIGQAKRWAVGRGCLRVKIWTPNLLGGAALEVRNGAFPVVSPDVSTFDHKNKTRSNLITKETRYY